jgi:hypothetical protein
MKNDEDKDIRTLDILTHEAGLAEMEDGHSTSDDRRWAREVAANMHARVAELRKSRLPKGVEIKKATPISERLLAMSRAALEALFGSLTETVGPRAQFAHRHLETLSDNDLRRMIQTIETHTNKE